MPRSIQIVCGKRTMSFPWGTVPRESSRTFDLDDSQIDIVKQAAAAGRIFSWKDLSANASSPAPTVTTTTAEDPPATEASTLAQVYDVVFGKPLSGPISRQDLVTMYESFLGKKAGKKQDRTLVKELCDAFSS